MTKLTLTRKILTLLIEILPARHVLNVVVEIILLLIAKLLHLHAGDVSQYIISIYFAAFIMPNINGLYFNKLFFVGNFNIRDKTSLSGADNTKERREYTLIFS